MFGVYKRPVKPVMVNENPRHLCQERFIRGQFANTNYKYQNLLYQKDKINSSKTMDAENDLKLLIIIKNQQHNEREIFKRIVRERVGGKMNEYEKKIDERRLKLNSKLADEERENITEVIKQVQTFADLQYAEKKQKVIDCKAKKEKERLEFANEMKFRQYTEKCTEIRPLLSHQKQMEAAAAQKIQREELKQRRESEKELQHFWSEMQQKQVEALSEVVEQKALERLKVRKEFEYFLKRQLEEQEAFKEIQKQEKQKELEELEKLKEKIREEERAEREKEIKRKEKVTNTLNEGVRQREEAMKQQTEDELKILRAFEKISEEELRKEQNKMRNKTSTAARDMQLYSQYRKELAAERLEDDKERERIENQILYESKRKYDEEQIKDSNARNNLLKSCIAANDLMIEEKRLAKERLKKKEDEENEFIRQTREQSNKLKVEAARQKKLATAKYRADLDNQVKYAELLKEREREKEKRVMKSAAEEEEKYASIVTEVLQDVSKQSKFHPFKRVVMEEKCPCLKPNY